MCFFHHGFRERSAVMFIVDLGLTLLYFVSFVHDYCRAGALHTKPPVTSLCTVLCTFISLATSLSGLKVRWIAGSLVRWIAGSMDCWSDGLLDRWTDECQNNTFSLTRRAVYPLTCILQLFIWYSTWNRNKPE